MFGPLETQQWLTLLHGASAGLIHVCATDDWTGVARDTVGGAMEAVLRYDVAQEREGTYVRMTTLRTPLLPGKRGSVADALSFPALWGDIDIAGPGHQATNLPPDEAAARAVVDAANLPSPTLWIHSGGGLYPIWLLDEPVIIDDDNRQEIIDLSANWQKALGAGAKSLGYEYGTGVGDLTRVLRVPGTMNRKAGLERPCTLMSGIMTRYTYGDLSQAAADGAALAEDAIDDAVRWGEWSGPDGRTWKRDRAGNWQHPDDVSPGDDFAARTTWAQILEPHGWRHAYDHGSVGYWRRPGKMTPGISATTNALGTDRLRVFSTDAPPFEATSYSKLGALAALEHHGDLKAAAKALYDAGYGTRPAEAQRAAVAELVGTPPTAPSQDQKTRGLPTSDEAASSGSRVVATPPPLPDDIDPEVRYREEVAFEARRQRIRRDARKKVDAEDFEKEWREPTSTRDLAEELELPDEPVAYRVDQLLPTGGNALLAAQFKAGKTTLCNNLVRALADGTPFLGRFAVERPAGRVALFNYEVGPSQYRAWLRSIGIAEPERVCVLNVRGYRLPPTVPQVEAWITKWLRDREVSVWVVDPLAAAFVGCGDENSNSDIGVFLAALDVIKERAGVGELILPVHTGRAEQSAGQERARGATRLDDWADARWLLTVDDQGRRYFRAAGRDVEVGEELLTHDPESHRLTIGGWDRRGMAVQDAVKDVVAYVEEHPGQGTNEIVEGLGKGRTKVCDALNAAVGQRLIAVVEGARHKRLHYPLGHTYRDAGSEPEVAP